MNLRHLVTTFGGIALSLATSAMADRLFHKPLIPNLPSSPTMVVSTIPANGDSNPYGVAFVPENFVAGGLLNPGDVIVGGNAHQYAGPSIA